MENVKNQQFDPNGPAGADASIFGLPYDVASAECVLLPVPWDVTVSYAAGTSKGPEAIFEASKQVDLYLKDIPSAWNNRIAMDEISEKWRKRSKKARKLAVEYIDMLTLDPQAAQSAEGKFLLKSVNVECEYLYDWVKSKSEAFLKEGKLVGLIGGDHSTPLGLIHALAEKHNQLSILQLDAHCDLRNAYEGFTYSHASIMFNALKNKKITKLVQVGIRDWCEEEQRVIDESKGRVVAYFDEDLQNRAFAGENWNKIADEIVSQLGTNVYLSFDIDGLDPKLCPNTGTPVPGGLSYFQALSLIKKIAGSGRNLVGFDLVEVAPGHDEWDANVGARLIYQIANQMVWASKQGAKTNASKKSSTPASTPKKKPNMTLAPKNTKKVPAKKTATSPTPAPKLKAKTVKK